MEWIGNKDGRETIVVTAFIISSRRGLKQVHCDKYGLNWFTCRFLKLPSSGGILIEARAYPLHENHLHFIPRRHSIPFVITMCSTVNNFMHTCKKIKYLNRDLPYWPPPSSNCFLSISISFWNCLRRASFGSSLTRAWFLMFFALLAYRRVLMVSS